MAKRDSEPHHRGKTKDFLFPQNAHTRRYVPSLGVRWKVFRGQLPPERLKLSAENFMLLERLTRQHREQTMLEDAGVIADY